MNHAELLTLLLPKPYEATDPVLAATLEAEGKALDAAHASALIVAEAISPAGANGLWLEDWERVLGLPDACAGGYAQTQAERIAAALSKIRQRGGQSRTYFIGVAAALGYDINVREYLPFRAGVSCAGDSCGEAWTHAWTVRAPSTTVTPFCAGTGCAGEPLNSWGNERLECVINRLKPAHTLATYTYGRTLGDWATLSSVAHIGD